MQNEKDINFDVLRRLEKLSNEVNKVMASRTRSVFNRYPLTFTLLVLFGVVAVSDGIKGILNNFGLLGHPWYSLIAGLIILIATGKLYQKLNK